MHSSHPLLVDDRETIRALALHAELSFAQASTNHPKAAFPDPTV